MMAEGTETIFLTHIHRRKSKADGKKCQTTQKQGMERRLERVHRTEYLPYNEIAVSTYYIKVQVK